MGKEFAVIDVWMCFEVIGAHPRDLQPVSKNTKLCKSKTSRRLFQFLKLGGNRKTKHTFKGMKMLKRTTSAGAASHSIMRLN